MQLPFQRGKGETRPFAGFQTLRLQEPNMSVKKACNDQIHGSCCIANDVSVASKPGPRTSMRQTNEKLKTLTRERHGPHGEIAPVEPVTPELTSSM